MKFIAIIPARYASSRFPGKPLAKLGGVEMIVRVCRRAAESGIECAVATDDERIFQCVEQAGFRAVMTSESCGSGTERVEEAYRNLGCDADVVINIQGDEPFIRPEQIRKLMEIFEQYPDTRLATLIKSYPASGGIAGLEDPNLVKITVADNGDALYFSRSVIPYVRGVEKGYWRDTVDFHTHIGIYAYRAETLKEIVALPVSSLERAESLEQLRWLQHGYSVKTALTEFDTIGIDTPADLEAAEKYLKEHFC